MLPRDNSTSVRRRADYRPPPFLVETLDLEFDLVPDATRVMARLAFRRNPLAAERVAFQDDEVDRLYNIVYRELLQYMMEDPSTIDRATWLLWVAHNLERMGDRIQNICERTVYEVTGVMREFTSPTPRPPEE